MTEADQNKQPIIDSVPGMAPLQVVNGLQDRQPVVLDGFKGDPRRVIGHPSNPASEAVGAYANHLRGDRPDDEALVITVPRSKILADIALQTPPPNEQR